MKIFVIGDVTKNMELAQRLEKRFPEIETVVARELDESRDEGDLVLAALIEGEEPKGNISFTFDLLERSLKGRVYELWGQYEDLESEAGRLLQFLKADRESLESVDGVAQRSSLAALVDDDMFTIAGTDEVGPQESDEFEVVDPDKTRMEIPSLDGEEPGSPDPDFDGGGGGAGTGIPELHSLDDVFTSDERSGEFDFEPSGIREAFNINNLLDEKDELELRMAAPDASRSSELPASPPLQVLEPNPDEMTAPGILLKNNQKVAPRARTSEEMRAEEAQPRKVFDVAQALLELENEQYSGVMEASVSGHSVLFTWREGALSSIDGYGHILSQLLSYSGIDKNLLADMGRRGRDPLKFALKRRLIKKSEQAVYLDRCREEAFLSIVTEGGRFKVESTTMPSVEAALSGMRVRPLILRGIVENYTPDLSWARGGGKTPTSCEKSSFDDFITWDSVDPLWIRAVALFRRGNGWKDAVVKSGLSESEGENLSYGLRLVGVLEPPVDAEVTDLEIERERVLGLLHQVRNSSVDLNEGDTARARRYREHTKSFIAAMDPTLRTYMDEELHELRVALECLEEEV